MLKYDYKGLLVTQEAKPPASTDLIRAVESKLGHSLPDQYKNFLTVRNGGYLHHLCRDFIIYGKHLSPPDRFYSIDSLLTEYKSDEWQVDPRLLPIAESGYGDSFMISVGGENHEKIFALDAILKYYPENRKARWPVLIADDFLTFVMKLVERQEVD